MSSYSNAALAAVLGGGAARWAAPLRRAAQKHGINTPRRFVYWLANALHETVGLTVLEENLNYSADRLVVVWPTRFTPELAAKVARNPEAIANIAYGGRLGNDRPGDGWRYRGRGIFQLTGKHNYTEYARASGRNVVAVPELLLQPDVAADSAGWYWASRNLNQWADAQDFREVVRRINGGYNGLPDREEWLGILQDAMLRAAESPVEASGDATRAILYDWTSEDAWGLLWSTLRGEREHDITGEFVWRVSPHAHPDRPGSKLMLRKKE